LTGIHQYAGEELLFF